MKLQETGFLSTLDQDDIDAEYSFLEFLYPRNYLGLDHFTDTRKIAYKGGLKVVAYFIVCRSNACQKEEYTPSSRHDRDTVQKQTCLQTRAIHSEREQERQAMLLTNTYMDDSRALRYCHIVALEQNAFKGHI